MTDLSKIKVGGLANSMPGDADFEEYEAKSLAENYGLAESIEEEPSGEPGAPGTLSSSSGNSPLRSIEIITSEILFYKAQAGGAILEIGRRLIEAKKQLSHGEWLPWLEEKVDFSPRSAQRFMKLAEGYAEKCDTVTLLGARKALALLALEDSEREEFLGETHMVDGEEKTAQDMSAEELEQAIRELEKAQREAKELRTRVEQLEGQGHVYEAKLASAGVEAEKARADAVAAEDARKKMAEDMKITKASLKDQTAEAKKRATEADRLRQELAELKAKPVEVAVREPTEEELEKLTAPAVEKVRAESQEQMRRLKKQLAAADPDTAAFKVLFEAWQEAYGKMMAALERVAGTDAGKADKLRSAVRAALERMEAAK